MNRWKWLASIVFLAGLGAAFVLWSQCPANFLAARGNTRLLRVAARVGLPLNRCCKDSWPLVEAVKSQQRETVAYLLTQRVDINVRDQHRTTPLMWAAQLGEATMCEQLIAAGADINAKDDVGSTALRYAVIRGRYETAEVLIKSGAHVNMPNIMGETVLMRAAKSGNIDLVRLLLSSGAERTFQAKNGTTALDYVPYPRNPTLVQLLGSIYFVPIGDAPISEINALVGHYREKFGMEVKVLPRMEPGSGDLDPNRQQLIAENVTESVRQAHPEYARNTSVILLGVTGQDMYPRGENWQFCFGWRNPELGSAVVSTARMSLHYPGEPRTEAVLSKRLQKVITKDIGIMLFGKPQSENPRSVLYYGIMGIQELDQVSEYF